MYDFCFSCVIKPTGLPEITFDNDEIKISASKLDCSKSLIDANFQNPPPFDYNSNVVTQTIAESYEIIFLHQQKQDCKVT